MKNYLPFIVILIALIIITTISSKRQQKNILEAQEKIKQLKVGDKIKTHLGIYGILVDMYDSTDGKIAKINISQNDTPCIVDVNFKYIASLDTKKVILYDENNNIISVDGIPYNPETIDNILNQENDKK